MQAEKYVIYTFQVNYWKLQRFSKIIQQKFWFH